MGTNLCCECGRKLPQQIQQVRPPAWSDYAVGILVARLKSLLLSLESLHIDSLQQPAPRAARRFHGAGAEQNGFRYFDNPGDPLK